MLEILVGLMDTYIHARAAAVELLAEARTITDDPTHFVHNVTYPVAHCTALEGFENLAAQARR